MSKIHGTNVHILPDENLGGVLREYVEVNWKAKAGDKIVIVCPDEGSAYEKGDIFTVVTSYENHPEFEDGVRIAEDYYFIYHSEYHTLEPTDVVRINGERYRLIDREAKEGEKVLVIDGMDSGKITKCEYINDYIIDDGVSRYWHNQYRVLEPVEPVELVTAEEGDDKSVIDLLANLARRVTELEKRVRIIDDYNDVLIDRMNDAEEKLEMILDDIVTLDERTQPLVALVKAVKADE